MSLPGTLGIAGPCKLCRQATKLWFAGQVRAAQQQLPVELPQRKPGLQLLVLVVVAEVCRDVICVK